MATSQTPTLASRQIFSAQHNPTTTIKVVFSTDPFQKGDQSRGLDVFVGSQLAGRFYNPAEVTAWFNSNSVKNVNGWQLAYHSAGLNEKSYQRPIVPVRNVVLKVPYFSQRDNTRFPNGTCNVTCYAMVFEFLGIPRRYPKLYAQREDELEYFLTLNKRTRHNHADLAWMGEQMGANARFGTNRTWDQIRAQIRGGVPVIVSGTFTKSGHIIVLIGCRGDDFIVHDPWGNALTGYKDRNGEALVYPFEYLERVVRDAPNSKWAHFFLSTKGPK